MPPTPGLTPNERTAKRFANGSVEFQWGQYLRIQTGLKKKTHGCPRPGRLLSCRLGRAGTVALGRSGEANRIHQVRRRDYRCQTSSLQKGDGTTQKAWTAVGVKEEETIENPLESGPSRLTTNKCSVSWDRNWTYVGRLGPQFLETCLSYKYPAIFTHTNLKALKKPGAKAILQHRLLQYVEFLTNWDDASFIAPGDRGQDKYVEMFADQCMSLGNRGTNLVIEPHESDQWIADGVYGSEFKCEGKVFVWHGFERNAINVLSVPNGERDFHIVHNYSETKAVFKSSTSDFSKPLAILLPR